MSRSSELPPAAEGVHDAYGMRDLSAPALSGTLLSYFIAVYEGALGPTIYSAIAPASGFTQFLKRTSIPEQPLFMPRIPVSEYTDAGPEPGCVALTGPSACDRLSQQVRERLVRINTVPQTNAAHTGTAPAPTAQLATQAAGGKASAGSSYTRPTVADYLDVYKSGATTPLQVAHRIVDWIAAHNAQQGWFITSNPKDILAQAQASTDRWASGQPLSLLDGVPWAIKDVVDCAGYPTSAGTAFLASRRAVGQESPWVTALKGTGAVLLGKTTLHEIGLGITGLNLRTGTARNPHNTGHYCGGSSSGSAAVVAAGLCPLAVGTDGGGSIRIPASFCGLVGLKPTAGRVTGQGAVKVDITTSVQGPICGTVQDCQLLYSVMGNQGDCTSWTTGEPLPPLCVPLPLPPRQESSGAGGQGRPLVGCRAGVYWPWFEHAQPEVVASCKDAVKLLEAAGAEMVEVALPELELLRLAHNVTIVSEMLNSFQHHLQDPATRRQLNPDVRMALTTADRFWTCADYLQAQRVRQRATEHFSRAFQGVDVLLSPSTPCTAPAIPRWAAVLEEALGAGPGAAPQLWLNPLTGAQGGMQ